MLKKHQFRTYIMKDYTVVKFNIDNKEYHIDMFIEQGHAYYQLGKQAGTNKHKFFRKKKLSVDCIIQQLNLDRNVLNKYDIRRMLQSYIEEYLLSTL